MTIPARKRLAALKERSAALKERTGEKLNRLISRHPKAVRIAAVSVLAAFVTTVCALAAGLPDRGELRALGNMPQATTLYDIHNRPVFTIFKEYRVEVALAEVSPHLRNAIVALEDQRFFDHSGIDPFRILGAAWVDLREGRAAQGGSTITQQLARQFFLTREKTLWRKAKEAILAIRLEAVYSKVEILELYLNKVYFGDGLYGAEAAARGYFGKSAAELTVAEAAMLAGVINAPSINAPTVNPARALARRSVALDAMADRGFITQAEAERAGRTKIQLHDALRREEPHGQYFKEEVRQQLVKQFGWERLSEGGLRVYTTIDPSLQRAAEATVAESLRQIDARRAARRSRARPEASDRLEAALVALDPATGEVRALVGGRDFATSRFNRAIQAQRQPGSAFKPFVYAAALESGYTPASIVDRLNLPINTLQGAWLPEDGHSTAEAMTVRTALRTSSNRAAVRMLQDVGIARTVEHARALGIAGVPSVPSLALGSGEVTLLSMTSAYAAFADEGRLRPPILIRRIVDDNGEVLFESQPRSQQAISRRTAFLMSSMLSDVINSGTGYRVRQEGFALPAAGKTGTTNDFVDAWFVGYTPKIVTGVWIGFDKPQTILPNGFAGDLAVPMWARFMKAATAGHKPEWFERPGGVAGVNVCRVSGLLPGAFCDRVYTEYFSHGSEPWRSCESHGFTLPPSTQVAVLAAEPHSAAGVQSIQDRSGLDRPPLAVTVQQAPEADPIVTLSDDARDGSKEKKRGFWSRVFGRRDKDKTDPEPANSRTPHGK
jgi:1A family penicillin-binding protein